MVATLDTPPPSQEATSTRGALSLLGGFGLVHGDGSIELPGDSQRLVAFLALQPGRVPRTYVAGTLWIDGTQARANGNLRSALWRLRRTTDAIIDADNATLAIAPSVTTDVHTLTTAANQLCKPETSATIPTDPTLFLRDLLPGWYDEWVILERERLRQLSLHALEAIAHHHTTHHHHAAALAAALAAIQLDPLRESAHRAAITVHLAEGNHSEALRQYHTYQQLLHTELDIPPVKTSAPRLEFPP